jgi:CDP-diacylglycerol---glycerol-3-phosphate 3-phosphatidyltransferase
MADAGRQRFWNVPNSLTMSRLAMSVVVFALIARGLYTAALVVFGLAALTDALDGYFARLLNQVTALGRQLDPLVDKVIVSGGLIYLLTISGTGLAPWMVTAIVVRELLVQGLRSHIEGRGEAFGARWAGKFKTTFQCLSIAGILLCLITHPGTAWLWARDGVTWIAVILTVYSGLGYMAAGLPKLLGDASSSAS